MWKGVTDFLENVDQKAAEFAHQDGPQPFEPQQPASTPQPAEQEEDWDLEPSTGELDLSLHQSKDTPTINTLPSPPTPAPNASSTDVVVLKQQLAALTKKYAEATRQHEVSHADRDKAYFALQGDYDALTAKNRSMAIEVEHWQRAAQGLEEEKSALDVRLSTAEAALTDASTRQAEEGSTLDRWERQCNAQAAELEEQRRELDAANAKAKRAADAAEAVQSELSDYRLRSRISLDDKDRQIQALNAELASAKEAASSVGGREVPVQSPREPPQPQPQVMEELTAKLRTTEERLRSQAELLQQRSNELAKMDESLKAQLLINAQLKELVHGEQAAKASGTRALEATIAERNAAIQSLERKVSQLQTIGAGGGDQPSGDFERKAKELAQLLMEKQSALESKRAEVDQWRTRYEVSQQRLREAELVSSALNKGPDSSTTSRRQGQRYSDLSSAEAQDSEIVSKHKIMTQLAAKGQFGAKVVGVAEHLDRFSLRAGGLLRHNSLLRVFLVCYVIVLQLYMFIVISVSSTIPHGDAHEGVVVLPK
eukprot:GILI01020502.1.p1 GENE.GILI01020502.1~~GILI01020502.1.p1  ORF type:complete len:541 (-),score=136.32 GILI01020502.1:52-1674(-)